MRDADGIDAAMADFFKGMESRLVDFAEAIEARASQVQSHWRESVTGRSLAIHLQSVLFTAEHLPLALEGACQALEDATTLLRKLERGA